MIDRKAINEKGKNQAVARKIRFWTQDGDFSLADELTGKQISESLQSKSGNEKKVSEKLSDQKIHSEECPYKSKVDRKV
jgi:hypothetical protein